MNPPIKAKLKSNIPKNYLYIWLSSLSLTDAIWMLYLAYRGMSLVQIGLLESIFHITGLTMEIPTGMIADRFGRKTSRVLGRGIGILATIAMLNADSFWAFAFAFVLSALSYNLESGAGDALVYDSLLATEEQDRYMKVKGRMEFFYQSARMISLVVGGWIATFSYELGYSIAIGVNVISFLMALTFTEPPIHDNEENQQAKTNNLRQHIVSSIQVILNNRQILSYVFYLESFSFFQTTLYFYSQNFFKSLGYTEAKIGIILAAATGAGILISLQTHRLEKRLGRVNVMRLGAVGTLIALGLLAFSSFEILAFIAMACLDGIIFVSFSDYINQLIPSAHRATLLSFDAMVFSFLMILGFPIFGWISSAFGFKMAFLAIFLISIPSMGFVTYKLSQSKV